MRDIDNLQIKNVTASVRRRLCATLIVVSTLSSLIFCDAAFAGEAKNALTIASTPPIATVFLDDKYVGVTPVNVSDLPTGRHVVKLTRHNYRNWIRRIKITHQQATQTLAVNLIPQNPGSLSVTSTPDNAKVHVDGKLKGETPLEISNLPAGSYHVRLEMKERVPWSGDVEIKAGKTTEINQKLVLAQIALLEKEIKKNPEKVMNFSDLGHLYMVEREYDKALKTYTKGIEAVVKPGATVHGALRLYNELLYVWQSEYNYGDEATKAAFKEKIEKLYRDGISRVPSNERSYFALANLLRQRSQCVDEIKLYEAALKNAARTPRITHRIERALAAAVYNYGSQLEKQKKTDEALAQYEKLVSRCPQPYSSQSALTRIIAIYTAKNNQEKAIEMKRRFISLYPKADACPTLQLEIADYYYAQKNFAKAIEEYERFLKTYPDKDSCPTHQLKIASIYDNDLKETQKALEACQKMLTTYPKSDLNAAALKMIGDAYTQIAQANYQKLLREYPYSKEAAAAETNQKEKNSRDAATTAYTQAAQLAQKSPQEAITKYEAIVKGYPRYSQARDAQLKIMELYKTKIKDIEKAAQASRRFVELFPDDDRAPTQQYEIGTIYNGAGEHEKAIAEFLKFVKMYPKDDRAPGALSTAASIYVSNLQNYRKAAEVFRQLVDSYPHNDSAPNALYSIAYYYLFYIPNGRAKAKEVTKELFAKYPYSQGAQNGEWPGDLLSVE